MTASSSSRSRPRRLLLDALYTFEAAAGIRNLRAPPRLT